MPQNATVNGRLLLALTAAAAVAFSSPFVGELNTTIQGAFPDQYVGIVLGCVVLPALAAGGFALARIREQRALRYGFLLGAGGLAVVYATTMQTTRTEQFHFTEYGLVAFLFYRAWRPRGDVTAVVLPICAALIAGFSDEWFQWFVPSRVGEARDVMLNGIGVMCGLMVAFAADPLPNSQPPLTTDSRRALAIGLTALILVAATFLDVVHVGHEIVDAEAGVFRSRYDADTLRRQSQERANRWQTEPPPEMMPLLSREDHFLTEAMFHVGWRNTADAAGDRWTAWKENVILERYYAAVLGTQGGWPDEHREKIKAEASADSRPYVSNAYPFPIYAWNGILFWSMAIAVVLAVWWFLK